MSWHWEAGDGAVPLLEGQEANVLSKDRKRAPQIPYVIKLVNSETLVCSEHGSRGVFPVWVREVIQLFG